MFHPFKLFLILLSILFYIVKGHNYIKKLVKFTNHSKGELLESSENSKLIIGRKAVEHLQEKYKKNETHWNYIKMKIPSSLISIVIDAQDIILGSLLGKGHMGVVYYGKLSSNKNYPVVIKKLHKEKPTLQRINKFLNEAIAMNDLRHPNIMPVLAVAYTNLKDISIVLPMMNRGTLRDDYFKSKTEDINNMEGLKWMIQIFNVIAFMHSKGYTHGDLHSGNVFVDDTLNMYIGDFGLTKKNEMNIQNIIKDYIKPMSFMESKGFIDSISNSHGKKRDKVKALFRKCQDKIGNVEGICSIRYIADTLHLIDKKKI